MKTKNKIISPLKKQNNVPNKITKQSQNKLEKFIKKKNNTRSKIDINQLQDLNNLRKPIFNTSRTNFAQNLILKKYVCNFYESYSFISKHVKIFENAPFCAHFRKF